jgi:serine/threonine protein kinase
MAAVLQDGAAFAGHRIERLLGVGGMGEVYLATQLEPERTVALKVIAPQIASDERFRRRFERESRLVRGLDHPNVIRVHDAGEHEGRLYMSMAYVEGLDLGALLAQRGALHPRHAALIVSQVASALDAAAAQGLVHRDVKPGNIFLAAGGPEPQSHLGDFGLSKHVSSTSGLTRTGHWVGTIDYASPEQLQAGEVDRHTDVYALGAVLHKALTGEVPYPRDRDVDKMMAHIAEPPPSPSTVVEGMTIGFDEVVARAMAKRPEERYASAGELGRAALTASEDAGAAPPWTVGSEPSGRAAADPDAPTAP